MCRNYQQMVFIMNPFVGKTALMPMSCAISATNVRGVELTTDPPNIIEMELYEKVAEEKKNIISYSISGPRESLHPRF